MSDMAFIDSAQEHLRNEGLGGWLVYDHRRSNPVFFEISNGVTGLTRPVFYFVPPFGEPSLLTHAVDAGKLDALQGRRVAYSWRQELVDGVRGLISGASRIAMEYVPDGALPLSSRVDAGTLEMVRGFGVEVVSSADLVQEATARWTTAQLGSHRIAADSLTRIVRDGFQHVGDRLRAGIALDERDLKRFLRGRMGEEQLDAPDGPIVAVGPHAADPHYEPTDDTAAPVQHGDWLLIDIWARRRSEDAVFADITWTASVGSEPHGRARSVFETVLRARDATVTALVEAHQDGRTMLGHEADSVARSIIVDAGFGEAFTHRLGHSIGREVHGNGANLDGFETHDVRRLIRGTGFSVEPGIYIPGEFGVRSEINVYLGPDGPEITTPRQTEVVVISI